MWLEASQQNPPDADHERPQQGADQVEPGPVAEQVEIGERQRGQVRVLLHGEDVRPDAIRVAAARDERVEAFTSTLWPGVHNYSYMTTATTPGVFVVPPAKAEEMYAPETFGRSASDKVIVR